MTRLQCSPAILGGAETSLPLHLREASEAAKGTDETAVRHSALPQRLLGTAAREGVAKDEGWRVRKDGTRFWADVVVTAIHSAGGTLTGFGKVTRDMTERRELREGERHARLTAEEANRAKDEFLATVSHELRTPLNVIVGEVFRLRTGRLDPQSASRAWESLERNVRLQTRLVEDLLDVSRIFTGKLQIERSLSISVRS